MCGIIGYVGERSAVPILLEGLKRLEYRGYDSSGIGVINKNGSQIVVRKAPGKINNLEQLIKGNHLPESCLGISHTRWATHGAPNKVNAHPHFDNAKQFLIVHNGIVENYEILKERLKKKGYRFVSETDTEVIAHLLSDFYKGGLLDAVKKTVDQLKGAFALGIISKADPHTLMAVRVGSPLIIGLGKRENLIASDVPAILNITKRIIYLKDREIAKLTKDSIEIFNFEGKRAAYKVHTVTMSAEAVAKQGYAHFMLKEIHEQPEVIAQMCKTRIVGKSIDLQGLNLSLQELKSIQQVNIVACGTAYHAGLVGQYVIEKLSGVPVKVDAASEFRYRDPIILKNTLIIAVSQSGETADTLAAVREAKKKGAKVVAICNVVGSSLVRESDGVLYNHAGPEIGVASTKAYTAQVMMLCLLALKLAAIKKTLSFKQQQALIQELKKIPQLLRKILKSKADIAKIAKQNSHYGCFLFLGRNVNYPSALEGALKLKEISYIPAEGYAAGEMKHGPIALIDEYRAVVCVATHSAVYEKMISNMQEIRARKGKIIAIATAGDKTIHHHAHHVMTIPAVHELLTPLLVALPLQLLAYHIAVRLGCDVDQPRNLAKSVTVE